MIIIILGSRGSFSVLFRKSRSPVSAEDKQEIAKDVNKNLMRKCEEAFLDPLVCYKLVLSASADPKDPTATINLGRSATRKWSRGCMTRGQPSAHHYCDDVTKTRAYDEGDGHGPR